MRQSSRIESLNYGLIYGLGCLVAAFLSFGQGSPIERLAMHTLGSWGYVIYYVLNVMR
jgi:hypothetical protein